MPFIHLTTFIKAPSDRVFDLSRNVDLHKHSMGRFREEIINGTITGPLELDQTVTWKARHLFKDRILKIKMTKIERPGYFKDEQVQGPFKLLRHEHYFKSIENGTIMIDQFLYEPPKGFFMKLIDMLYLEKYMTSLLNQRNEVIKKVAESDQWKKYLMK